MIAYVQTNIVLDAPVSTGQLHKVAEPDVDKDQSFDRTLARIFRDTSLEKENGDNRVPVLQKEKAKGKGSLSELFSALSIPLTLSVPLAASLPLAEQELENLQPEREAIEVTDLNLSCLDGESLVLREEPTIVAPMHGSTTEPGAPEKATTANVLSPDPGLIQTKNALRSEPAVHGPMVLQQESQPLGPGSPEVNIPSADKAEPKVLPGQNQATEAKENWPWEQAKVVATKENLLLSDFKPLRQASLPTGFAVSLEVQEEQPITPTPEAQRPWEDTDEKPILQFAQHIQNMLVKKPEDKMGQKADPEAKQIIAAQASHLEHAREVEKPLTDLGLVRAEKEQMVSLEGAKGASPRVELAVTMPERLKERGQNVLMAQTPTPQQPRLKLDPSAFETEVKEPAVLDFRDQEAVFPKLVQNIQSLVQAERSEVRIVLKPDHLGDLKIKLSMERGIMVAEFVVQNEAVREVIASHLPQLHTALQEQGTQVADMMVNIGFGQQKQEDDEGQHKGRQYAGTNRSRTQGAAVQTSKEAHLGRSIWNQVDVKV